VCRICDLPVGRRTREALRQALITDCTADPRTGQPGTGSFADLLEWIQLANFSELPTAVSGQCPWPASGHDFVPRFKEPRQGEVMRAVQIALNPQRLNATVAAKVFQGRPTSLHSHLYLLTAELHLVRTLLHARCSAGSSPGLRHDPHHLRYTFSLLSMFWADTIRPIMGCVQVAEGGAGAYDGLQDCSSCVLEVQPTDGNGESFFNRHALIYAPILSRGASGDTELQEQLLAHACGIRQQERATGRPSASATGIAERNPHWARHTALTLPLLNMACDGFRACIAFHVPSAEGTDSQEEEDVCYWAQARDDREYVLYMLLMITSLWPTDMRQLIEGAQPVNLGDPNPAPPPQDGGWTVGLPKYEGVQSEKLWRRREDFVTEHLEGQKHVFQALINVLCAEGHEMWLPLTEDLLRQRGQGIVLRVH
jgi:hypothetical protein